MKLVSIVAAGLLIAGCAGADAQPEEEELPSDVEASAGTALMSEAQGEADDEDEGEARDEHHHRHRLAKLLFKLLDRLDGTKDKEIVLASLPAKVPAKLLEKLHAIDTNGDGIVTKAEAKAAWKAHDKKH
jgi:hypothetical protein